MFGNFDDSVEPVEAPMFSELNGEIALLRSDARERERVLNVASGGRCGEGFGHGRNVV